MSQIKSYLEKKDKFLIFFVVVVFFLLRVHFIFQAPVDFLKHGTFVDDTFYYFSIAKNFLKHGIFSADGIHKTSGFQPLYLFVLLPIFWLFNDSLFTPMVFVLIFQLILSIAFVYLLFFLLKRISNLKVAFLFIVLLVFSPYFTGQMLNGLETPLAAFFFVLFLYYGVLAFESEGFENKSRLFKLVFSAISTLMIFSRLDLSFFLVIFWFFVFVKFLKNRGVSLKTLLDFIKIYFISFIIPFFVIIAYLLILYFNTGYFTPDSGAATSFISRCYGFFAIERKLKFFDPLNPPFSYFLKTFFHAVSTVFSEAFFFPFATIKVLLRDMKVFTPSFYVDLVLVVIFISIFIYFRKKIGVFSYFLVISSLIFVSVYSFFVGGQWWFPRYFFPVMVVIVIVMSSVFKHFFEGFKSKISTIVYLVSIIFVLATVAVQSFQERFNKNSVFEYFVMAQRLNKIANMGDTVGSFQSGALSYFYKKGRVINLDGVVNRKALIALKQKSVLSYILSESIVFIADWPVVLHALLERRSKKNLLKFFIFYGRFEMDLWKRKF